MFRLFGFPIRMPEDWNNANTGTVWTLWLAVYKNKCVQQRLHLHQINNHHNAIAIHRHEFMCICTLGLFDPHKSSCRRFETGRHNQFLGIRSLFDDGCSRCSVSAVAASKQKHVKKSSFKAAVVSWGDLSFCHCRGYMCERVHHRITPEKICYYNNYYTISLCFISIEQGITIND